LWHRIFSMAILCLLQKCMVAVEFIVSKWRLFHSRYSCYQVSQFRSCKYFEVDLDSEDFMSLCSKAHRRSACVALVLAVVVVSSPSLLSAQDETPPKADLFIGYQWLNPGGTVPVGSNPPFQPPPPPVATKLPSMPIGYGVTGTYNFDKWWGLSIDVGGNFQDLASESTISGGPRLMGRGDNSNMFVHTMLGLNRLSPKDVHSGNGIRLVLGGGIDLT